MADVKVTLPRDDYSPNQRTDVDVEVVNPDGSTSTRTVKGAVQSTTEEDGTVTFGIMASAHVPFGGGSGAEISDDFSGTLSAWDQRSGTWSISSGELVPTTGDNASALIVHDTTLSTQDHYAQVDITSGWDKAGATDTPSIALVVRYTDDSNFTWGRYNDDAGDLEIYRTLSGSTVKAASTAFTPPSQPWTLKMEHDGSDVKLYVDGSLELSYTMGTSNTGTKVGLRAYDTDGSNDRVDNFEASAIA